MDDRVIPVQQDEIQAKDDQIGELTQQLHECTLVSHEKHEEIEEKKRQLQQNVEELTQSQERELRQLNEQLEEQEQVTAEIQKTNRCLQNGRVEELQQLLSQQKHPQTLPAASEEQSIKSKLPKQPSLNVDPTSQPPSKKALRLNWRDRGKAPLHMARGAAVVEGEVAYFVGPDGQGCSYNSINKKWKKIPRCSYLQCSLAVINGQLTAIGGRKYFLRDKLIRDVTNKLLSLSEDRNWKEIFPPTLTKRYDVVAISSSDYLIVAGGMAMNRPLMTVRGFMQVHIGVPDVLYSTAVEVMDIKTRVWFTVASLPDWYNNTSAIICGDHLYMLGGDNRFSSTSNTNRVLTCSLTKLVQSSSSSSSSSVWHRIADAPAYRSTCANINGELLAVGGHDIGRRQATRSIHKYNPTTNSWDEISNMSTARYECLIAVLPTNEMMVVGGKYREYPEDYTNIYELAAF